LRFKWLGWLAAVYAMAAMGCSSGGDTTTLVVLVEDCAGLTSDLVRVHARVEAHGETRAEHDFPLEGADAVTIPFSFGIAPGAAGASERITVIVEGYTAAGGSTPTVVYTATNTGFIEDQALLLDVCLDSTRTESRPPSTLRIIQPGDEVVPGVDAGTDATTPPTDAGTDTGLPDVGLPDGTSSCTTTCGSIGTCTDDCSPEGCLPPPEQCNGVDDNCNGEVDDGFTCAAGTVTSCVTSCDSIGTRTCTASCTPGECVPPAEICGNGEDDNCDGVIDSGCQSDCDGTCPSSTVVSAPGGRFVGNTTGGPSHTSDGCGGGGPVRTFTFTLESTSDVFLTTHGSDVDTVLYVRSCSCDGEEMGCNDDADGRVTSALQLPNLPNGTYTVFVDTKGSGGSFQLDLYISPPGTAGNRCGRPRPLATPTASGTTCGFTNDHTGECEFPGFESFQGPDTVYYFVVDTAGTYTFDTWTGCTDYDTSLALWETCTPSDPEARLTCNDDYSGNRSMCSPWAGNVRLQSQMSAGLSPGVYYVFVDSVTQGAISCGNYTLTTSGP
jgi:hypothetical protein